MNWKSNLLLVFLAAGVGVWLWKGDEWLPQLAPNTAPSDAPVLTSLEADFTPGTITRIEIVPAGGDPFVFEKSAKGWSQPGNWPLRTVEVNGLVDTLGTLRTRFQPVPVAANELAGFGLGDAQNPLRVKVTANGKEYALKFGQPDVKTGEAPFTRPAYVRIGDANEVLKLGPDVMPVLRRPADLYRRRQLFAEVERVKFAGTPPPFQPGMPPEPAVPVTVTLPGESVEEIRIEAKSPKVFGITPWQLSHSFTLKRLGPTPEPTIIERNAEEVVQPYRLADAWAVEAPVRNRAEPAALQRVLGAVPDLWVEEFIPAARGALAEQPFAIAQLLPVPLEPFTAALLRPASRNGERSAHGVEELPAIRERDDPRRGNSDGEDRRRREGDAARGDDDHPRPAGDAAANDSAKSTIDAPLRADRREPAAVLRGRRQARRALREGGRPGRRARRPLPRRQRTIAHHRPARQAADCPQSQEGESQGHQARGEARPLADRREAQSASGR